VHTSPVSHLSLSTSNFGGPLDLFNVIVSVDGGKEFDCSRGLLQGDNGFIRNDKRNLRNLLDSVSSG